MQNCMKRVLMSVLTALMVTGSSLSFAAEEQGMTQGEAAVMLAERLHLAGSGTKNLTATEAAALLLANGISPLNGWKLNEPLVMRDFARMLVQALGREDDISSEDRADPETQAYANLLAADYGFDPSTAQFSSSMQNIDPLASPSGGGVLGSTVSTDPLETDLESGEQDELGGGVNLFSPVSSKVFQTVIVTIPAARPPSGGGGASDDGQDPVTPNVPVQVTPTNG